MEILAKGLDQFNEIHDHVEHAFEAAGVSIHNALWQIIINHAFELYVESTLYAVPVEGQFWLCRVERDEMGFYNLRVPFKKELGLPEVQAIQNYLNEKLFGQTVEQASKIIDSSMFHNQVK